MTLEEMITLLPNPHEHEANVFVLPIRIPEPTPALTVGELAAQYHTVTFRKMAQGHMMWWEVSRSSS